ncbi:hypothetical protein AQ490_25770 [Wenjunlia vitaminophila]|uniref:HTH araC/xylS-type domain-containing protein n=1 Tax=Wenjunlia vitaminophila TaxID=76728 RepID=A0A0T6LQ22_WENVI|nr:AraC family transcriptional regulator [Wenjunlia vitaminophila]KRV48215.1 hypothetical protein AQ490_25770 [Wenjunlia vitaminophila]
MAGPGAGEPLAGPALGRLHLLGTASAHEMVQTAHEHGVPWHRSLRDTGIAPSQLGDATGTISMGQELALGGNLVSDLSQVPGLGLSIGARYPLTMYGVWGLGLLAAPTPRQAVAFGLRYVNLSYACCALSATESGGEMRIRIDATALPEQTRRFFTERTLGAVVRLLDDLMPDGGWLRWVSLAGPGPDEPERYHETLAAPVSFNRPNTEVRVDSRALDRPLPLASEPAFRLAEQQCRELLTRRSVRSTQTTVVREYVLQQLPHGPDMAGASAALRMSERTLRRRLAEEGTSFSAILDEVRRTRAESLLGEGMPATQVARRLGYTEPAAFTHAFKRWTGRSPRSYGTTATEPPGAAPPARPAGGTRPPGPVHHA